MSFELEETPAGVDVVVTGAWTPEAGAAITDGRADGLVLNYARGFNEQELGFLAGVPLRRLHVLARTVKDLTPVHALADTLQSLRVQSDPGALVDLAQLPRLQHLSAGWRQVRASIGSATSLQSVLLLSYDETDLTPLTALSGLRSVVLKDRTRLASLAGLEGLPSLTELGVHAGSHLTDISALQPGGRGLQTLQLSACRRVDDLAPVAACAGLSFLEFSDSGDVASVQPLADLTDMERLYLYESTKVLDGDLTPIAGLPRLRDFRMQNRRHYRPTVPEIQARIDGSG